MNSVDSQGLKFHHADSIDSDLTGHVPSPIRVLAVCTSHFVDFRLI